jgi:hypothetical protein
MGGVVDDDDGHDGASVSDCSIIRSLSRVGSSFSVDEVTLVRVRAESGVGRVVQDQLSNNGPAFAIHRVIGEQFVENRAGSVVRLR